MTCFSIFEGAGFVTIGAEHVTAAKPQLTEKKRTHVTSQQSSTDFSFQHQVSTTLNIQFYPDCLCFITSNGRDQNLSSVVYGCVLLRRNHVLNRKFPSLRHTNQLDAHKHSKHLHFLQLWRVQIQHSVRTLCSVVKVAM